MMQLPRRPLLPELDGDVLVDGMFDNPNYWFRYNFIRSALGLHEAREIGVLGEFARTRVGRTFRNLGIRNVVDYRALKVSPDTPRRADNLSAKTKDAAEILDWTLPQGFPGKMAYDAILKRQRLPAVSVDDESFAYWVRELFGCLERSERLLDAHDFKFVSISHPFSFHWGSINWCALQRRIPVVMPFGAFGSIRAARLSQPDDVYAYFDRPNAHDVARLGVEQRHKLAAIGADYMSQRLAGRATDLASFYAFQQAQGEIDRAAICNAFGWSPGKPIVAFYASNWFDWPHQLGMSQFRDFLDWTEATLEKALENTDVNWLLKPHPCEEWFGGVSLASMLKDRCSCGHVRLTDKAWNNTGVLQSVDAIVTYHGTIGVEAAVVNKPVLVPDHGKYDDLGFVKVARDRADYLELLSGRWWDDVDLNAARAAAELFSGWWFCIPEWQGSMLMQEDARQEALYPGIIDFRKKFGPTVDLEVDHLRDWFLSGHPFSHTYKMLKASEYRLSNV